MMLVKCRSSTQPAETAGSSSSPSTGQVAVGASLAAPVPIPLALDRYKPLDLSCFYILPDHFPAPVLWFLCSHAGHFAVTDVR